MRGQAHDDEKYKTSTQSGELSVGRPPQFSTLRKDPQSSQSSCYDLLTLTPSVHILFTPEG